MVIEIKGDIRTDRGWGIPTNTVTLRKGMVFMVKFGEVMVNKHRVKEYMKSINSRTEYPSLYEICINNDEILAIVTFSMVKKDSQKYEILKACGFRELYCNE